MAQLPKLWILYEHLSKEEKKGVRKWILMTHPQETSSKRKCWAFLEKGKDPIDAQQKLFANRSDPNGAFRRMVSELAKDVEDYLITQLILKDPIRNRNCRIEVLNQRPHCEKWVSMEYNDFVKQFDEIFNSRDNEMHRAMYDLQIQYQRFQQKMGDLTVPKTERILFDTLNKFYLYERYMVELAHVITARNRHGEKVRDGDLLLKLSEAYRSDVGIHFLEKVYRFLINDQTVDLDSLCQAFQKELVDWFSLDNQKAIFSILHSCLLKSMIEHHTNEHIEAVFEWYIWGFKQELLVYNGILPAVHYKNFFKLAYRLRAFEQVRPYLTSLTSLLDPEEREELSNYQELMFHFESREDLDLVLRRAQLKYSNHNDELNVRLVALKVLFEQQKRREFRADLNSLNRRIEFLKRKMAQPQINQFMRRSQLMEQLYQADLTKEVSRKAFLDFLDTVPIGPDHEWVRSQVDLIG